MTVLVVGAAVSGRAAAALLRSQGEKVVVYDANPEAGGGIDADEVRLGDWDASLLDGIDLVVSSPGVPEHAAPVGEALGRGVPVWSEVELAFRHLGVPIAAVTATNGKTTVTEAAAAMLAASGLSAAAVGNIGDPLSAAVGGDWDALVVEASSFQLRFVETFRADCAVLLNFAPDHLDWHPSVDAYRAAKARILERQDAGDWVVFDGDDPGASAIVENAAGRLVPVSAIRVPEGGWGVSDGVLRVDTVTVPLEALARRDDALVVDLAAAAAAALRLGATPEGIAEAAVSYRPGRHRRELVGTWDGVAWINDSKATNPHAALAAIRSFPSVVLIAGGLAKGLDPTPLVREPSVRHVVAMGACADELAEARPGTRLASSMGEAVHIADECAESGDTVLLAPGCASFDMFDSYADRGNSFRRAVLETKEA